MSKFADQLREGRIFNNFGLLNKYGAVGDVAIEYSRPAKGCAGWGDVSHTVVWSPFAHPSLNDTNRRAALSKYGRKEFLGKRSESWPQAIAWAAEQFGHIYVPSPFGGYIPKHVRDKAHAAQLSNDRN